MSRGQMTKPQPPTPRLRRGKEDGARRSRTLQMPNEFQRPRKQHPRDITRTRIFLKNMFNYEKSCYPVNPLEILGGAVSLHGGKECKVKDKTLKGFKASGMIEKVGAIRVFARVGRVLLFVALLLSVGYLAPHISAEIEGKEGQEKSVPSPSLSLPGDVQKAAEETIARERKEMESRVRPLLKPEPLGFDVKTVRRAWQGLAALPSKIPGFLQHVREVSRLLGLVGSFVLLAFLVALFYSFFGQKKVLRKLESSLEPLRSHVPTSLSPYFLSIARIIAASLIPLILFGVFSLIRIFFPYEASWWALTGRLLKLWAIGALVINFLRETLTSEHLPIQVFSGRPIFRVARFITLYTLISIAFFWSLQIFSIPKDGPAQISGIAHDCLCLPVPFAQEEIDHGSFAESAVPELPHLYAWARAFLLPGHVVYLTDRPALVFRLSCALQSAVDQNVGRCRGLSGHHALLPCHPPAHHSMDRAEA